MRGNAGRSGSSDLINEARPILKDFGWRSRARFGRAKIALIGDRTRNPNRLMGLLWPDKKKDVGSCQPPFLFTSLFYSEWTTMSNAVGIVKRQTIQEKKPNTAWEGGFGSTAAQSVTHAARLS